MNKNIFNLQKYIVMFRKFKSCVWGMTSEKSEAHKISNTENSVDSKALFCLCIKYNPLSSFSLQNPSDLEKCKAVESLHHWEEYSLYNYSGK